MLLGFKTELKLNNKQRTQLVQHAGCARHAYNEGLRFTKVILDYNKNNPDNRIKFPSAIDLHKWLVASIKPQFPWYYNSSKCAPQYALRTLREAWDRCFKKVSKEPVFKKKGKRDSFTLDGVIKIISNRKIQVPVIGVLRTYEELPIGYKPKSVTISRRADKWYISYKVEIESLPNKAFNSVGVDLGVLTFATLSTGESIDSPRSLRQLGKRLAKLQWRNRKKQLRSKNWHKAQLKIAKLHAYIADIRKDFIHKLTNNLTKNHSHIVIEDLNVSGMLANHKLAKAIADSGFYEFRRQLSYKTQLYGSELILADRFFPSSKLCNNCGCKKQSLPLSERIFKCNDCGFECNRDFNAALNLSALV